MQSVVVNASQQISSDNDQITNQLASVTLSTTAGNNIVNNNTTPPFPVQTVVAHNLTATASPPPAPIAPLAPAPPILNLFGYPCEKCGKVWPSAAGLSLHLNFVYCAYIDIRETKIRRRYDATLTLTPTMVKLATDFEISSNERVIKPTWPIHLDEKDRPQSLYSLAVHPDGSRLATGGLDTKIRIWSTAPILDEGVQNNEKVPKLLCTLSSHSGVVMHLRWSFDGRYLASGSDDKIVMIWALEAGRGGKVWGSEETNVENWKATKRLVGHDSDVVGVAWSADGNYLASVGLDNSIFIWRGHTFELLRRINGHQGFVKGVVFDPAGQYLATQSDDNTLKIWRTSDWGLEADISAPFQGSPKTNICRLSWSPEGAHIVTPNSMNGPVFVAAVIERKGWISYNSMVGHENIVENAAFCPLIFLRDPKKGNDASNLCTLVAISARSSISLWMTDRSEPLVVLESVFERDVLDLSWSADGTQLWSCSSEGHVGVFIFDIAELNIVAPKATRDDLFLKQYGVRAPVPINRPILTSSQPASQSQQGTITQPNVLAPRKGPNAKRKIVPSVLQPSGMMNQGPSNSGINAFQPPEQNMGPPVIRPDYPQQHNNNYASTSMGGGWGGVEPNFGQSPVAGPSSKKRKTGPMEMEVDEGYGWNSGSPYHPHQRLSQYPNRAMGHTIGEERVRGDRPPLVELRPMYMPMPKEREVAFAISNREASKERKVLAVPAVMSMGEVQLEDSGTKDTFEWRNFDDKSRKERVECTVVNASGKTLWLDYLPSFVVGAAGSPDFAAVSTEDGTLIVYSPSGRRLLPPMVLDSPTAFLVAEGPYLMAITAFGSLTVWNTCSSPPKSLFPPLSITSLLTSSATRSDPHPTITTSSLLPNGIPLIALSSGTTHSYDANLTSWIKLSEPWWAQASLCWEGRRGKANATGRGLVRTIESAINDIVVDTGTSNTIDLSVDSDEETERTKPEGEQQERLGEKTDFEEAVTLAHLETKMKAAIALDSPSEYRAFLQMYAKRLADEGVRNKAEELIKELLGPIYYKPSKDKSDAWSPTLLGINKRDLLREVLSAFNAKSRLLTNLVNEYQGLLKKIDNA